MGFFSPGGVQGRAQVAKSFGALFLEQWGNSLKRRMAYKTVCCHRTSRDGIMAVQGHPRSLNWVAIKSAYALQVSLENSHPIFHAKFEDVALGLDCLSSSFEQRRQ